MHEMQFRFVSYVFDHVAKICKDLEDMGKLPSEGPEHMLLFQQCSQAFSVIADRVRDEGSEHAEEIFRKEYKGAPPEEMFLLRAKYLDLWGVCKGL